PLADVDVGGIAETDHLTPFGLGSIAEHERRHVRLEPARRGDRGRNAWLGVELARHAPREHTLARRAGEDPLPEHLDRLGAERLAVARHRVALSRAELPFELVHQEAGLGCARHHTLLAGELRGRRRGHLVDEALVDVVAGEHETRLRVVGAVAAGERAALLEHALLETRERDAAAALLLRRRLANERD